MQSDVSPDVGLGDLVNQKIQEIDNLLVTCQKLPKDIGGKRLVNKFIAERKVLLKYARNLENITEEHLRSSNVTHLSSILWCALSSPAVVEILKPFVLTDANGVKTCRIFVDVVADSGNTWVKVVARNPQSLLQSEIGAVSYGKKTLAEQIEQLKECARKNRHLYQTPKIQILFAAGVLPELKITLEKQGVGILEAGDYSDWLYGFSSGNANISKTKQKDTKTSDFSEELYCDSNASQDGDLENNVILCNLKLHQVPQNAILNLDVSTMIAYVSSLTNGYCNYRFESAILSEQAACERENPVKSMLDDLFKGRKLICCATALKDFTDIIDTIGGVREKARAKDFLKSLDVVDDMPSSKASCLGKSCKVKNRPQLVFGTGDLLEAITVTANKGFLRAAQAQGIHFVAFVHESRALTEAMEPTAMNLSGVSTQIT